MPAAGRTSISYLATDWIAVCGLALLLGLRHGVDADHLAAIDGMTRLGARRGAWFARWCGVLFSLGHGVVVLAIAFGAGLASSRWQAPAWLDALGAWVSIGFLVLLGALNLRALVGARAGAVVAPIGVRAAWMAGLFARAQSAWSVVAVGVLFAISFDTLSQSLLFAVVGARFGGVPHALVLGALFVLGMLASDGLNGWWIFRLIARTDRYAAQASRVMGWTVTCMSFAIAGVAMARMALPTFDRWWEGRELWLGTAVVGATLLGYAAAWTRASRVGRTGTAA